MLSWPDGAAVSTWCARQPVRRAAPRSIRARSITAWPSMRDVASTAYPFRGPAGVHCALRQNRFASTISHVRCGGSDRPGSRLNRWGHRFTSSIGGAHQVLNAGAEKIASSGVLSGPPSWRWGRPVGVGLSHPPCVSGRPEAGSVTCRRRSTCADEATAHVRSPTPPAARRTAPTPKTSRRRPPTSTSRQTTTPTRPALTTKTPKSRARTARTGDAGRACPHHPACRRAVGRRLGPGRSRGWLRAALAARTETAAPVATGPNPVVAPMRRRKPTPQARAAVLAVRAVVGTRKPRAEASGEVEHRLASSGKRGQLRNHQPPSQLRPGAGRRGRGQHDRPGRAAPHHPRCSDPAVVALLYAASG